MITDVFLTSLSNSLGALAVILIVVYQFVEVNAKRTAEAELEGDKASSVLAATPLVQAS